MSGHNAPQLVSTSAAARGTSVPGVPELLAFRGVGFANFSWGSHDIWVRVGEVSDVSSTRGSSVPRYGGDHHLSFVVLGHHNINGDLGLVPGCVMVVVLAASFGGFGVGVSVVGRGCVFVVEGKGIFL